MKKYSIIIFLLVVIIQVGTSQDIIHKYNKSIRLSPFEFGRSQFQVGFEKHFNNRSRSILLLPSFILKRDNVVKSDGIDIGMQYRMFLSHNGGGRLFHNIGFYTGGYAHGLTLSEEHRVYKNNLPNGNPIYEDASNKVKSIEGGVLIGLEIDITERIVLDWYVGGGVRYSDVQDQRAVIQGYEPFYEIFDREYTGIKPRIGFQLGITL